MMVLPYKSDFLKMDILIWLHRQNEKNKKCRNREFTLLTIINHPFQVSKQKSVLIVTFPIKTLLIFIYFRLFPYQLQNAFHSLQHTFFLN